MIDSVFNLLFRCSHRHLTRPFTPLDEHGVPRGETYVVCLDCTKQFAYDLKEMRIGKAVGQSHKACVVRTAAPKVRTNRLPFTLGVAVPIAFVLGTALTGKKRPSEMQEGGEAKRGPND